MNFAEFEKTVEEHGWELHGIEVVQNGTLLYQYGDVADTRYPIYSATKTFTSTAAGLAVEEGNFSIEESVYEYLKADVPAYVTQKQRDALRTVTIRRLLTMSVQGYPFRPEGNDWLEYSLACPLECAELPRFSYSNIPAYLVGVALERALNQHLMDYLTPRLFEPLSMDKPVYQNCPAGHFYGASGMKLTVQELGKLGALYLQNGSFKEKRILSENWVREATDSHIKNREGGYGYFIWKYGKGYRISGKWGQRCMVFPDENLMITYLSNMEQDSEKLTGAVERYCKNPFHAMHAEQEKKNL